MQCSCRVQFPHPAPSNFCLNLPSLSRPKLQHSKQHTLHSSYISSQFNSFAPHHTPHPHPSRAGQGGHLMGTMMSDVTRAIKQLPCVSVAAIDGQQHTPCNRHTSTYTHHSHQSATFSRSFKPLISISSHFPANFHPLTRRCDRWGRRAVLCLRPALHVPYSLHSVISSCPFDK